jgi:hypothetical protein
MAHTTSLNTGATLDQQHMRALRILAGTFFLFAALALVSDVTRWTTGGGFSMTSIASFWRGASPLSLELAKNLVSRSLHPWLWDPLIWRLLLLPAWITLSLIGLLCARLGRRRDRVNIFVN